ncbi:MAG: 2-C-methyl-D-erythritol 4-phosphate cytidylyltransferase [candidate division KSB1 bacterium]|nr:2-C-methyl-D-erythritol 4-phosphate cytidylyltransferase [candidate division KSB1 bacterium]
MFVSAVIVAGGVGRRIGSSTPKQFLRIADKPILQYTLEKFDACRLIDEIICVLPLRLVASWESVIRNEWQIRKAAKIVGGGEERYQSVLAGLDAVSPATEIVMIHDGVRPFVSERILAENVRAAAEFGAAVTALPPKDTIKRLCGPQKLETLDRAQLVQAQTPQTFRIELIRRAYQVALQDGFFSTDDSALVERLGEPVAVVEGEWRNIKITSPEDLLLAEVLLTHEVSHRTRI